MLFALSVGFSTIEIVNASMSNDSNRKEVYFKSGLDITMSVVAFIPVVGWVISGTYFIADAFGAFGDWGEPTNAGNYGIEMDNGIRRFGEW